MSITLYSAYAAWINAWEAFLLRSDMQIAASFCAGILGLALMKAVSFCLSSKALAAAAAAKTDQLEADLTAFKGQMNESIGQLSTCMQKTVRAANAAIDDIIVIQDGGLQALQKELRTGPLALEVQEIKTSTAESIRALQMNFTHLNQLCLKMPSTEDVQEHINENLQKWYEELKSENERLARSMQKTQASFQQTGDAVMAMGRSVTLQGEAIDAVIAWAKRGRWHNPLGGTTSWALLSEPKW